MNFEIFNMLILSIGGVIGLWETLLLAMGKKILKGSSEIVGIANFGVLVYGLNHLLNKPLYQMLSTFALILAFLIIRYYSGVSYRVNTENDQGLKNIIVKALGEIDYMEPAKVESEGDTTRFHIPDSKRMIELKQTESMWGQKKVYHIIFKRWLYYESKKEILRFIEDSLDDQEGHGTGIFRILLQVFMSILLIAMGAGLTSYMVMEPREVSPIVYGKLPEEIHLLKENRIRKDKDVILRLDEQLKNAIALKSKTITDDEIQENAEVALYYEDKERIVYIGRNNMYLFIHDSETGNKSTFYWICWKIHQLYDKNTGMYYRIYGGEKEIHKILEGVIQ